MSARTIIQTFYPFLTHKYNFFNSIILTKVSGGEESSYPQFPSGPVLQGPDGNSLVPFLRGQRPSFQLECRKV